jgi:V8-like Glu-specific endopeptidase/pimeloyl-ACP methyl ester carboxylesterase
MFKRFVSLFLSSLLCVTFLGTRVIAQVTPSSNQQLTPVAIKFNPKTDAQSYRPPGLTQSDQPTERAIVGEDNRFPVTKREFPWTAIGRIYWLLDGGKREVGYCTGTLISKDLVLTNSHCLEHPITKKIVDQKTYKLSSDRIAFVPNMIEGRFNWQDVAIANPDYVYGWESSTQISDDWALLKINKPLGEKYGYLGWRDLNFSEQPVLDFMNKQVRLAGYSGDYPNEKQRLSSKLRGQEGETAGVHLGCSINGLSKDGVIIHDCDTMGGSSGSSMVARFDDDNYYVIGLHRGSIDLNRDTLPPDFKEECKRFEKGEIITVGACRNLSVQVSQWSVQAAKMRLESLAKSHTESNQINPSRITESNGTTVILPASYNKQKSYPAVVLLPFTGGTGLRFFDWAFAKSYSDRQTNPFIVIIPSGTGKSSDYETGEAFSATIQRYEKQVKSDLKTLTRKYNIDAKRVSIGGYSLGADLGWALSLRNPDLFRGAILIDSICGYRLDSSMNQLAKRDFRAFMIVGRKLAGESNHPMNSIRALLNKYQVSNLYKEFPKSEHETILNDISPEMLMQSVDYSLAM